jgi:hypothetical protein
VLRLTDGEDICSGMDEAPHHLGCGRPRLRHREDIGSGTVFVLALDTLDAGEELLSAHDRLGGGDDD